jgi:formiminotetrahydrofolate cyclodeaminase
MSGLLTSATIVAAASIVSLVLRLAERSHPDQTPLVRQLQNEVATLTERFFISADEDAAAFHAVMESMQASRAGRDRPAYLRAIDVAAEKPLDLAEDVAHLVEITQRAAPLSPPFALADVRASAVLADAAGQAALFIAETNIELFFKESDSTTEARSLDGRRRTLSRRLTELRTNAHVNATDSYVPRGSDREGDG